MWFQHLSDPEEAGWFQEAHANPDKFGSKWAMTPTHRLQAAQENSIVLLSTGGFAPIHDGHIDMMESAKIYMESQGFHVRGGYVSPGHDDYVVAVKKISLFAPERLGYANKKIENHPWLMVDPWEAIGTTCSVNYTAVIDHLQKLLGCRVCYVVGSDNARFALAFKTRGLVCVVRRTADVLPNPKYRERSYQIDSGHVFYADNKPIPGSSTETRKDYHFDSYRKKNLVLRVDPASEPYMEQLISILYDYYLDIWFTYIRDQKLPEIPNLVSLDQMIESSFGNLGLSRNYAAGGYHKLGYINRPGTPPLEDQLKVFADKEVNLFDDDVVSGNTMLKAEALLRGVNCRVIDWCAFTHSDGRYEIMDSRDFLPVPHGGLVVNGTRVPYTYPYVCPYVRASILPEQAEEFSDRIRKTFWK